tara:strand:- start:4963 stop:5202 length:240 start_codon:yes stop_codon:yes gene_type:complete
MPFDKLYLKIKCNICNGTRVFNHGHHDPHDPLKWKRCPYCDPDGHAVVEATPELIAKYIMSVDDDVKERILESMVEEEG